MIYIFSPFDTLDRTRFVYKKEILNIYMNSNAAEIAGMFAADGCLQKGYLCMWGNIHQDKDYYDFIIKKLFNYIFNIDLKLHEKKSNSVYGFYLCDKKIVKYFNEILNFKIGNKTYDVSTPKIILNNNKYYTPFIRGFVDCDGCLNFDKKHKSRHYYPRIIIKCASLNIIKDIQLMLNNLGINKNIRIVKTKNDNESNQYEIVLMGKNAINYFNKIGFNNPVNTTKYKIWKKWGFCPANISLEERRKILKGEINPYCYYGPVAQPG